MRRARATQVTLATNLPLPGPTTLTIDGLVGRSHRRAGWVGPEIWTAGWRGSLRQPQRGQGPVFLPADREWRFRIPSGSPPTRIAPDHSRVVSESPRIQVSRNETGRDARSRARRARVATTPSPASPPLPLPFLRVAETQTRRLVCVYAREEARTHASGWSHPAVPASTYTSHPATPVRQRHACGPHRGPGPPAVASHSSDPLRADGVRLGAADGGAAAADRCRAGAPSREPPSKSAHHTHMPMSIISWIAGAAATDRCGAGADAGGGLHLLLPDYQPRRRPGKAQPALAARRRRRRRRACDVDSWRLAQSLCARLHAWGAQPPVGANT